MVRPLIISSAILGVCVLTTFAGCSSSSSSSTGSGSGSSSGSKEAGASSSGSSSGTASSSGSSSGTASSSGGSSSGGKKDGGSSSGSSSGSSGGDGSTVAECPDNATFTKGTYTTPTAHQGVCQTGDITSFLAACVNSATAGQTACFAWQTANVSGADGGGGNACGNCILNGNNNGASFITQASSVNTQDQLFGANYGACIALTDKTNGAACEQAYDTDQDCQGFLCADCLDQGASGSAALGTCDTTVAGTGGACNSYDTAAASACPAADFPATDGGVNAAAVCFPSENDANATDNSADFSYIINLICGSADGG